MSRLAPLLVTLLLAPLARADDPRPQPELTPPPVQLELTDLELIPLDQVRWQLLNVRHAELLNPLHGLARQARNTARKLARRENQRDGKSQELRQRLANLHERARPLLAQLRLLLLETEAARPEDAISDARLARMRRAPPAGPRRPFRYAHGLVAAASGLDPRRQELLSRLVAAVDGAQLSLEDQRAQLDEVSDGSEARQQLRQALNRRVRQIERRFWRVADYVLDDAQKREVRRHLPHGLSRVDDPLGHVFRLPGLKPAQGARIRALMAGLQAEVAADQAEARRLERQVRSPETPQADKPELHATLREVRLRILERTLETSRAGREVLSDEQFDAYLAIPPMVSPRDRNERLRKNLAGFRLTPAQAQALADLADSFQSAQRELQSDMAKVRRMQEDYGPDSPQMQMVEMMSLGVQGKAQATQRRAARTFFLEILTPDQVASWVVTP